MNQALYDIIEAMETRGGSFVQALAKAMKCADPENMDRIKTAFPDIIERYESLAAFEGRKEGEA